MFSSSSLNRLEEEAKRLQELAGDSQDLEADSASLSMTEKALASEEGQEFLKWLVEDEELAAELARVPLPALFYAWLAFFHCAPFVGIHRITVDRFTGWDRAF